MDTPAEATSSPEPSPPRFPELHEGPGAPDFYRGLSDGELRAEHARNRRGAPMALMIAGASIVWFAGPTFLIVGTVGVVCAMQKEQCPGIGTYTAVSGGLTAVSGGMLIGGLLWLDRRDTNRRAIEGEMRRRENDSATLGPRLSLTPLRGGASLSLRGHF